MRPTMYYFVDNAYCGLYCGGWDDVLPPMGTTGYPTMIRTMIMTNATDATDATDAPLTARKTVTITAVTPDVFPFETVALALSRYKGGAVEATYDGTMRAAKSEKAAVRALVDALSISGSKPADYKVVTADWESVSNAPEYTADKDNAAALKKLSTTVDKAGKALADAEGKSRASVLKIGAALLDARALLAVDSDSATGKPAKAAWGRWIDATPFAAEMRRQRAANISEAMAVAAIPAPLLDRAPAQLTSAKSLFNFYNRGYTDVATLVAKAAIDTGKPIPLVTDNGKPHADLSSAAHWDAMLTALEAITVDGVAADKMGVARHGQTPEEEKDGVEGRIDPKMEKARQSAITSGVFADHIFANVQHLNDADFAKSKFGKSLARVLDALANVKTEAEKQAEKQADAAEVLAGGFDQLPLADAIAHIATICAKRVDTAAVLSGALEYWESEFAPAD